MSVEYEVLTANQKKNLPATAQRGPLVVWELTLKSPDGETVRCERNKKPQNLIKVGDKLFGYIEERDGYPANFKETTRPGQEGQNQGGGKKSEDFDRRPDHPLNVQRARHSTVLGATPEYYRLMVDFGIITPPDPKSENPKSQIMEQLVGLMAALTATYPLDPRDDTTSE